MDSFDQLVEIIEGVRKDVEKTDRGNKAAGTRVRKAMQDLKKQAQVVRADVLAMRAPKEECCPDAPCPDAPPAQSF